MVISKRSQLGLRFNDTDTRDKFKGYYITYLKKRQVIAKAKLSILQKEVKRKEKRIKDLKSQKAAGMIKAKANDYEIELLSDQDDISMNGIEDILKGKDSVCYLICDSVYKAAELIKIGDNFTSRTLKDINFGMYTYLMGKHEMIRFMCDIDIIEGIYYNEKTHIVFNFSLSINKNKYSFETEHSAIFSRIMQIITFVELGDIEIEILPSGRKNNPENKSNKLCNNSLNTVFVVDSSWNKLIIREDGFAVRGHFRLQSCGYNLQDRKLIWINAFEKHGYVRKPKASITR